MPIKHRCNHPPLNKRLLMSSTIKPIKIPKVSLSKIGGIHAFTPAPVQTQTPLATLPDPASIQSIQTPTDTIPSPPTYSPIQAPETPQVQQSTQPLGNQALQT